MTARRSILVFLAVVAAAVFSLSGSAQAVENPDYVQKPPTTPVTPPEVEREVAKPGIANRQVAKSLSAGRTPAAATVSSQRQTLAITGSDTVGLAVIGSILLAGGAAALVARRRMAA